MVRPAGTGDAALLAGMLHDFNREFGEPSPGEPFLAARVAELISACSKHYLVAATDPGGRADGFAQVDFRPTVWADGPVALLEELYVRPACRGNGLGRELMDAVLGLARECAASIVEVITGEDDTAARGLYESTGFRNRVEGEEKARALYYELEL